MKKLFALILAFAFVFSLASCTLVRKIEDTAKDKTQDTENAASDTEEYNTDFSESVPDTEEQGEYNEDGARELLGAFLKDKYTEGKFTVTTTEAPTDIVADSNGNEYYIFNATIPSEETAESNKEPLAETKDVTFYVSSNGVIYETIEEDNITVKAAKETYVKKHGDTDKDTGFKYNITYQGTVKNNGIYCYNFIVYLEDNSSGETKLTYKTNYVVSLDGRSSGEQAIK